MSRLISTAVEFTVCLFPLQSSQVGVAGFKALGFLLCWEDVPLPWRRPGNRLPQPSREGPALSRVPRFSRSLFGALRSCYLPALPFAGFLECAVLDGDNCVFDGVIYRSGEKFEPNCQYHCTCRDGQIGCVPRCQLDVLLPGPDCPAPRKVAVPGECCEKWTCGPHEEGLTSLALPGEQPQAPRGRRPRPCGSLPLSPVALRPAASRLERCSFS